MKDSLFPEMEAEIREDRKGARREATQRAREALQGEDLSWLINHLMEHGPSNEHEILMRLSDEIDLHKVEEYGKHVGAVLTQLVCLHKTGKLWRKYLGIHQGSGCKCYQWGIRKVHKRP